MKSAIFCILILTGCAASCKRASSEAVVLNPASAAAVKSQFDVLRDSVNVKWNTMTASDDQRIGVTRMLLHELKGRPGMDAAKLKGLESANAKLKTRRYSQQTMASSDLIDQYDTAQDSLMRALMPVAAPNGTAPTEAARNYVEGLQQLDAGVIGYRVKYDQAARQYNDYLKLHQAELQSLGGKYAELKPLPLFELQH
ncbi:hypothetical protein Q3A66_10095 [Hymenobacter sp. BT770]|uniref:hypothetical protein n=1 Tax=Hymenobacter sp. BT770 TaxID=2886942 RepID=UPI001D113AF3|nr:hypothetical protein [Hymenobacter sp. BT770]MCC3153108.1 hypothetical protein [Hymenobacter sp. BT770]MDO3415418.1 hypothetical protein [Hymenobacter sp. BT770]